MNRRLSECVEWSKDYRGELENNSPVWFVVDQVYAGIYSKDLSIFCMADDKGFNCCDAVCFAPIGASRQLASYPKHGERVAVEIPQLPCIVTGTFNMKYLEEGAIDPVPAIELDPIYDFGDVSGAIAWSKVFAWYVVPEIPSYLCYDKTNIVEVPCKEDCEEECCEDVECPVEDDIEEESFEDDLTQEVDEDSQEVDLDDEISSEIVKSSITLESFYRKNRDKAIREYSIKKSYFC